MDPDGSVEIDNTLDLSVTLEHTKCGLLVQETSGSVLEWRGQGLLEEDKLDC